MEIFLFVDKYFFLKIPNDGKGFAYNAKRSLEHWFLIIVEYIIKKQNGKKIAAAIFWHQTKYLFNKKIKRLFKIAFVI